MLRRLSGIECSMLGYVYIGEEKSNIQMTLCVCVCFVCAVGSSGSIPITFLLRVFLLIVRVISYDQSLKKSKGFVCNLLDCT